MYQVSVPLVRFYENYEENISQARKLGAQRVFFCPSAPTADREEKALSISQIQESRAVYESAGLGVGVWISTMGHGGDLIGLSTDGENTFTHITGLRGITTENSFCPLDSNFSDTVCEYLKEIAQTGVEMIMLDDDFRFSHRGDCGCTCHYHMAEYAKRLGEPITREEVFGKVFGGGYNRYRQVYYDMLGDTLRDFACKMRSAIDEVNPAVRFGFCAVTSSWDCDGTDALELSKIMAGETKPFLRFIGAPYWSNGGNLTNHVQYVAELERMQAFWCRNSGVEIFSEGDTYPRPRYVTPAALLEHFDTILRADGSFDGILKYGVDYVSSPTYENGYADRAQRNRSLYQKIDEFFGNKKSVGVHVTCEMKKMLHTYFDNPEQQIDSTYDSAFYQSEQLLLTNCAIPATYDDAPITIAFGENGKYIQNKCKGFILDAISAMHLQEKGVDTGVSEIVKGKHFSVTNEFFIAEHEMVSTDATNGAVLLTPAQGATVLSEFTITDETGKTSRIPACIQYENAAGQRFLVYAYDFDRVRRNTFFMRNYMRQAQLVKACAWLAGERLPAVCTGHPDLYIMVKKQGDTMAVGLWNIYPDEIFTPVVELDKAYRHIRFIGCNGVLDGDKVRLQTDIPAYGFAAFEVTE